MENVTEKELMLTELLAVERNISESMKGALAQSNANLRVVQAQAQQMKDAYDGQSRQLMAVTEELRNAKANWQKLYDDHERLQERLEMVKVDGYEVEKVAPPKGY